MAASLSKRVKINDSDSTMEPSDSEKIKVEPSDSPANSDSESDNEDRAHWPLYIRPSMTDEEYKQYLKEVIKSKGFDVPRFEGALPGGIVPINIDERNDELLTSLSKQALVEYNTKENAAFQFVELVKATHQAVAGKMYYITFKAKEDDDDNCQTFKTKVWKKVCDLGIEVKSCAKV